MNSYLSREDHALEKQNAYYHLSFHGALKALTEGIILPYGKLT